jgi:hypothetical protein
MAVRQVVNWMSNTRKRRVVPLLSQKNKPISKVDRVFMSEFSAFGSEKFLLICCVSHRRDGDKGA